ncbi:MAG: hypothetical protein ACREJ3_02855, partial [Polyangiaceae bacterium]
MALSGLGAACGSSGPGGSTFVPGVPDASLTAGDASSPWSDAGFGVTGGDAARGDSGGQALVGPLVIGPANKTIDVNYGAQTPSVTYTATIGGQIVPASFAIDRGEIGSIVAASGVLAPAGFIGGTANVTATYGGKQGSTPVTVRIHLVQNGAGSTVPSGDGGASANDAGSMANDAGSMVDAGANNSGGSGGVGGEGAGAAVPAATQTVLMGAPVADSGLEWLYPYNGTVWPRGLLAPLLQWTAGHPYDAVFIHVSEPAFDYQGFFSATATTFVHHPIPQAAWEALGDSNRGENVTVTLVFSSGGKAYGPLIETWKFAQTFITGTVYYNSYGTNLAHNFTYGSITFGGATLAIKHGATSPTLVAGSDTECRVCHSVSADGSRLVTQEENNSASSTYDLKNGNTETMMSPGDSRFAWAALYPDGTFLMTDGARGSSPVPYLQGSGWNGDAQLFALPGGASVTSKGIPVGLRAASPVFSPDGKHV